MHWFILEQTDSNKTDIDQKIKTKLAKLIQIKLKDHTHWDKSDLDYTKLGQINQYQTDSN